MAEKGDGMLSAADVLLGFLPGLLWLAYIWRKDDWEPEPRWLLLRVFLLGCAAALLIARLRPRIELILPAEPGLAADLMDAFVVTALSEELVKVAAFALGILWHRECDEPLDGIIYGGAAALGFASLENAYFLAASGGTAVLVARAFTANLAHVAFTALACFCLVRAKLEGGWRRGVLALWGFAVAVVLHGTYDLFLESWPRFSFVSLLLLLPLALVVLGVSARWARARSPLFHPR